MRGETISYTIDIGANIEKVKKAMREISNEMDNSNLDSKITAQYERKLGRLRNAVADLESKAGQPLKSNADVSSLENSLKTVDRLINQLGIDFKELSGKDLSKSFGGFLKPIQELKKYTDAVQDAIDAQDRLKQRQEARREDYRKQIADRQKDIDIAKAKKIQAEEKEPVRKEQLREQIKKLQAEYNTLNDNKKTESKNRDSQLKIVNDEELKKLAEATKKIKEFKEKNSEFFDKSGRITKSKIKKEEREAIDLNPLKNEYKQLLANQQSAWEAYQSSSGAEKIEDEVKKYEDAFNKLNELRTKIADIETQMAAKKAEKTAKEKELDNGPVEEITAEISALGEQKAKLEQKLNEIADVSVESEQKIKTSFENLRNAFSKLTGDKSFEGLEYTKENFEKIRKAAEDFSAGRTNQAIEQLRSLGAVVKDLGGSTAGIKDKIDPAIDALGRAKEASNDFDHLISRLKYFFSLAGGFNLMRRAIRSAVTTTKELDAVMTQTAVVSQYSVSDMWKTLPQYSKEAQKLGAAIKDVYGAQTLYVQQGLDMNSAMQIGIETMKMARVANIGAEEATNSMTAALRGFNMELTERSAKRVNDVYSKLAQNTASNTQEISTAMTKTAALANSANMSFENTAAFLATIIESTREGAETAGTALKTVIARFTEVKKLYSKGELTGTDEEGQEVNVNKISAALRTAGINMNDFFTGAKGLDEIFVELGSKWDSLTTVQQRYIATMAAGSRQQSRFLALMQNYNRTLELSSMAYNSAGSGQEQFDKTLDSLEAKINKFKDAWDTFVMSLTNSDAIKGIVDFGTEILDLLNNLIDKISGGNGAIKSILSLGSAFGIFKVGRSLVKGLVGTFKGDQSKGLLATLLGNRAEIIKHFSDIKAGFQRPLFTRRKGVGAANRKALIEAENNAKKEAQAAQTAYNNEVEKLNNGSPVPRAINSNLTPQERERVEKKWKEKQLGKVKTAEDDLSKKNQEVTRTSQESATALQNYGAAMSAVGVAAGIVAGLLGLVANHLEETGKSDLAKVVKGLALGLGVLSATLMVAGSAFQAFGAAAAAGSAVAATAINAIPIVGWIIGIVTVLTTAGTIIAQFVETAKEKLENAEKAVEEHAAYLSGLKDKYSEVSDTITSIGEQQDAIANMTERTLEWSDAVEALNKNLKDFISDYPEYANAVQFDEHTGQLTLDLKTAKEIQEKQAQIIEQNEQEQRALKINQAAKQYKVDLETYGSMYILDSKGGIPKLSEKYYSSGFSKYSSQFFNKLGRAEYRFTQEDLDGLKDAFSTDFLKEFFGDEDFLKERLELLKNVKAGDEVGDLANFFMEIRSLVGQAESYKNYQDEIKNIARPEAVSYVSKAGNYSGVVKSVAQQVYEKAHDQAFNNYSIKDVDQTMIDAWAKRNHYTLVGKNQYSYQENGVTVIKEIDKDEVLASAQYEAATQAAKQATDLFFQGIADESYAIASGKGTYREYLERYRGTLEQREGEYYVKAGENEKYQLYNIITDRFLEARKRISTIAGTYTDKDALRGLDTFYQDLNYLQTTGIANLVESWQSKFGTSDARDLLNSIEGKLKNTNTKELSNVTDDLLNILQQVESGAITSLEEFNQALLDFGLEGLDIDIGYVFKKPKGFEQAQEDLKTNLEFWNSARSSTTFDKEGRSKLIQGGMNKGDFILTSQGYVSTKSTAVTGAAAKKVMISGVQNEIDALDNQINAINVFNTNLEEYSRQTLSNGKTVTDILNSKDLSKENGDVVKQVLKYLAGNEVYNQNKGEMVSIDDIDAKDAASYLQYYLDNAGNGFQLRGQRSSLQLELGEIKNNKLLDLAPTIQSAIVDIITRATEKGINVSDKDIDKFIGGRAQFGSDKKYSEFLGGLEQLDWDEIDDIDDFIEKLKELGIEFYNTGKDAKDLYNKLKEIYASDSSTTEKADKKIKKLTSGKSAAEKIASGETTLSDSEFKDLRDILKESYSFVEEDWIRTGLDEWTYVGNDTNSILMNIDSGVQAIAAEIINEAKDAVDKGQSIERVLDKKVGDITVLSEEGNVTRGVQQPVTVSDVIKGLKEGKTYTQDILNQTGWAIGLRGMDFDNFEIPADAITSYYDKYYGDNREAYLANEERYKSLQNSAILPYLYSSPQALLNAAAAGKDNGALRAQVVNNDLVAKVDYLRENATYGNIFTEISTVSEEDGPKKYAAAAAAMKDYEIGLEALALASGQAQKNIADLNATINENIDILKNSPKGSDAYIKAIDKVWKKAKKVFGENITKDFIEDNLPDFEAWAKGGEKGAAAFKRLSGAWSEKLKSGFKDFGEEIGIVGDDLAVLEGHWSELDGSTLEVGATADFTDLFNGMQITQEQGEKLAEYLSSIPGVTAIWVPGKEIEIAPGEFVQTGHLQVVKDDGSGGDYKGGGGGGGKKFKNDFDKYYNQVEDINELERQRNLLEKDYQQLLKAQGKSGAEIYQNLKKQLELLEERKKLVADLAEKRKGQLFDVMQDKEYKKVWKYAKWNDEDQTIEIDWDAINKIKNSKEGDLVKEYIKKLEEYQKMYDEQIDALKDIEDSIQEINKRGKEEYQNLEDRTRDALIKQIQDKIDELTGVNEAINDTNQKLFDKISETLELQRQDRENQKTEEELSDKEKRLAYLRQDSSNANQVEIAQLEKELDEAREDYTDTLIDQKISELQKQNEKAQEQREEQIELMQQSLDWQEKNGMFWEQAYALMSNSIGPDGTLVRGSQLEELLKRGEGWQSLSEFGQMNWLSELESLVAQAIGFLSLNRQLENIGVKEGTQVTFTNKEGKILTGTVDKDGNVIVTNEDGTSIYKGVYQDYNGKYATLETEEEAKNNAGNNEENNEESSSGSGSGKNTKDWAVDSSGKKATVSKKNNQGQYYSKSDAEAAANALNSWDVKYENGKYVAVAVSSGQGVTKSWAESEAKKLNEQLESSSKVPTQYATGGLNTETGLAWLDGTKSHPELVLNARDTENFIELKDTLTSLKSSGGLSLTGGENYYDIDIQVDSLGSDYDVDRMIDRIKSRIVQDNAYRNVNTLSRLR